MATTPDSNLHDPALAGGAADAAQEREQARRLADRYRCGFIDLTEQRIDPELFRTIPADLMFRYNFVPLVTHNNTLVIAVADPGMVILSDELPLLLGKKLAYKVATPRQIGDLLKRTEQSQRVLEQATEAFTLQVSKDEEESEETISGDRLTRDSTVSPVVRLVETIIFTALERRASDIHIEARDAEVAVKYRIDGVLQHAMQPIAKEWHSTVISRIKVLSDLDIAERRVPQYGSFRVKYKGRYIDLRVSIMPASHGEDAVLRVLDKETLSEKFQKLSLDVVGFSSDETRRFRRYIHEPYGMVLVTGPTGSGKTTTLYAAINEIKTDEDKIVTIEDPVEYQLRGITQIPVNEKKGLTFARGLRSILRHDPDKIMVGEIRDQETAQIAIQSALTGHLVFTTVRQQRHGRHRAFHQHGRRAVQLRFRSELHPGATPGARDLRELQAAQAALRGRTAGVGTRSCRHCGFPVCGRAGMPGMLRHRVPRAYRDLRIAGLERPYPGNDRGPAANQRDQAGGHRRGYDYAARERHGESAGRDYHAARDQ